MRHAGGTRRQAGHTARHAAQPARHAEIDEKGDEARSSEDFISFMRITSISF